MRRGRRGRGRGRAYLVHVFGVHPFNKGDVVVLVGRRRELCSAEELEKG